MTDRKFTDDEIVELLRAYVKRMCGKCNVRDLGTCCGSCFITAISQAADRVNIRNAEIERLTENFNCQQTVYIDLSKIIKDQAEKLKTAKAEAIKEFAREHREIMLAFCDDDDQISLKVCEFDANTNNLVKEMTETNK